METLAVTFAPKSSPLIAGNLPTDIRYRVKNSDGSVSTVRTMSIGTDRGEVLIPTVINGRVVSDEDAIRHFERTGENFGTFRTIGDADAYATDLHNYHDGILQSERPRKAPQPVSDGRQVISSLFPNARITSGYRGPDHPLSKANPRSWHARSRGAVDMAPIPGMTFDQAKRRLENSGYRLIEALDETGSGRSRHATGDHWHFVIGQ